MEYINHFTLNTGHNRKSYPNELKSDFIFKFKPVVDNIINDGGICKFYFDTYIKITTEDNDRYVATLYILNNEEKVPILITNATSNTEKRLLIESDIKRFRRFIDSKISFIIPEAPVIVDIVLADSIYRPDLLAMTGDLTRCLAWTILDPGHVIMSDQS